MRRTARPGASARNGAQPRSSRGLVRGRLFAFAPKFCAIAAVVGGRQFCYLNWKVHHGADAQGLYEFRPFCTEVVRETLQ